MVRLDSVTDDRPGAERTALEANGAPTRRVWLHAAVPAAAALADALRARGLRVTLAATHPADGADALVFVAPRPADHIADGPVDRATDRAADAAAITRAAAQSVGALVGCVQQFVRALGRDADAAVVVVTDIAGIAGREGRPALAAASGALLGAVKCLAKELGRQSVRVNAVAHGFVPALGADDDLRPAERRLFELMKLGRAGGLDALAVSIAHLAGERHLVTGQVLRADDGLII